MACLSHQSAPNVPSKKKLGGLHLPHKKITTSFELFWWHIETTTGGSHLPNCVPKFTKKNKLIYFCGRCKPLVVPRMCHTNNLQLDFFYLGILSLWLNSSWKFLLVFFNIKLLKHINYFYYLMSNSRIDTGFDRTRLGFWCCEPCLTTTIFRLASSVQGLASMLSAFFDHYLSTGWTKTWICLLGAFAFFDYFLSLDFK